MRNTGFRVFASDSAQGLEKILNDWLATMPELTRIRRTQLAASHDVIYALVNFEVVAVASPARPTRNAEEP